MARRGKVGLPAPGEVVRGVVSRVAESFLTADVGCEAVLPWDQQVPGETFQPGDRLAALVLEAGHEREGARVVLSRSSVGLLTKLFAIEVTEIRARRVIIEAAAREAGVCSKIAVFSRDPAVDPVGVCRKHAQAVSEELGGERVDVVRYHADPARFVLAALAPAQVSRIAADEEKGAMEVIVPDDQVSIALGRSGENVRLAAQLTGWTLDVYSESRVKAAHQFAKKSLCALPGVDEALAETLYACGFHQAKDVVGASPWLLARIPGVEPSLIPKMQSAARLRMEADEKELRRIERERARPIIEAHP